MVRKSKKDKLAKAIIHIPPLRCESCGSLRTPTPSQHFIICPKSTVGECENGRLARNPWKGPLYLEAMHAIYPRPYAKAGGGFFILDEAGKNPTDVVVKPGAIYDWKERKKAGLPPSPEMLLACTDNREMFVEYELVKPPDPAPKAKRTRKGAKPS